MAFTASISIVLWFLVVFSSDIINAKTVTNSSLGSVEKQHDKQRCVYTFGYQLKCNVSVLDNNTDFSIYPSWFSRLDIWCDTVMPSSLMDGLFEPLGHSLLHISIYNCYIVSISKHAFRGMKRLDTLWIGGGNNSKMNGCGVELSNVSTVIQPPQPELAIRPATVRCNHDSLVLPEGVFSDLESLMGLTLESMRLNSSVWHVLENLSKLRGLSLTNNNITTIDINTNSKLKGLYRLYLSGNNIQSILNGTFELLSFLDTLDLSTNKIRFLEKGAFKGLSYIFKLNLSINHIRTIEMDIFEGLINLDVLDLSENQLKTIPTQAVSKLKSLKTLDLSYNFIETLPTFRNSLQLLDLSNNDIVNIYNNSFEGLPYLSNLNLGSNSLAHLPADAFNSNKLQSLDLSFNHIVQLPILPKSLKSLNLRNNDIVNIYNNSFVGLSHLSNLNLGSNSLAHLPEDAFTSNKLQSLDLSFNYIVQLPILPNSLSSLNLRNNNIADFSNRSFVEISYLSKFDMSQNKIRECPFYNIPHSMNELNLSSNNISVISFNLTPYLSFADLRNNQLISLTVRPIQKSWYTDDISLGHIYLAGNGNPFRCDCNLEWRNSSFSYKDRYAIQHRFWAFTSLNCSPVYEDEPGVLTEIDLANFNCRYTVSCPDNCTCYHWKYGTDINIVNCQDAGSTSVPDNISRTCTILDLSGNMFHSLMTGNFRRLSKLEELYLNSSNIAEIQKGTFGELFYVTKLDLSHNNIRRVNSAIFKDLIRLSSLDLACNRVHLVEEGTFESLNGLKDLDLSDNEIEQISNPDMTSMYTFTSLKLSKNPWSCECSFLDNFVKLISKECIQDPNDIICFTSNKTQYHVTRISIKEFCPDKPDNDNSDSGDIVAITVSTAVGVLAITIMIGILWFKNRKFLKVCCFIHFGWLFGSTPNDEQDKPYDAFVSYSSLDDGFVVRELMPRLEMPLRGQQGYTLCVHFRDFPVGAPIAETILHAVRNSRRVIMILSDNFLRSEWCQFEFQAAHRQLLEEKKNRIITVLLHDINTNLLDEHLSMFLSTRTYVKYGDALFWSKIEYAMPKRKPATEDNLNADNHEEQVNNLPAVLDDNADDDIQLIA